MKGIMAGAGFFAAFQAEAWRRIPGVNISAVADPDSVRAEAFAERWGIAKTYASVEAMLDRERPDFIDIVTRPETHRALTELAAERGVHVICQKPMAPALDDCAAMVEACERAGVRLLIHENWRWQPWYRELKRLLESGVCGRVFHFGFKIRTGDGRGPEPYTVQPYFREMERFLVYETLVHFLDTLRFLGGEFRSVYCRTARVNPLIRGEDAAVVDIAFASGARGLIDANRISGPAPPEETFGTLAVEGDRASVKLSPDGSLWVMEYGRAERRHAYEIPRTGYRGDSVKAHQEHLLACLESGRPAESEARDYMHTVRAVFAYYDSAASGCAVTLGS